MKTVLSRDAENSIRQSHALCEMDYAVLWNLDRGLAPGTQKHGQPAALTPQKITSRIRYLEKKSIAQTAAQISIEACGYKLAHCFIRIKGRSIGQVANDVAELRSVIVVSSLHDKYHLIAIALVSEENSSYQVLYNLSEISGVCNVSIELVLRQITNHIGHVRLSSPQKTNMDKDRDSTLPDKFVNGAIDEMDRCIVNYLQRGIPISNRKIAEKLDVTEGTIRYRIKRLEERDVLKFVTTFNPKIIGLSHWTWLQLDVQPKMYEELIPTLKKYGWIKYLAVTTGKKSLVCLALNKSKDELTDILHNEVQPLEGVEGLSVSQLTANYKLDKCWGSFS